MPIKHKKLFHFYFKVKDVVYKMIATAYAVKTIGQTLFFLSGTKDKPDLRTLNILRTFRKYSCKYILCITEKKYTCS